LIEDRDLIRDPTLGLIRDPTLGRTRDLIRGLIQDLIRDPVEGNGNLTQLIGPRDR
jgi:hypothetical protein